LVTYCCKNWNSYWKRRGECRFPLQLPCPRGRSP
jgi:hypothetical protein